MHAVPLLSIVPPGNLKNVGRDRWRGRCPIQEHRSLFTFSVSLHKDGHQVFLCFACGQRGSVIDLYAALKGIETAEAIRKLSAGDVPELSREAILQKVKDQIDRAYPKFGYAVCDKCGAVFSEDNYGDARSWGWKVSRSGKVCICPKHEENI